MSYEEEDRRYAVKTCSQLAFWSCLRSHRTCSISGRISREEAVDRVQREGMDGSFLLRMSTTQDGVYTVCESSRTVIDRSRSMQTGYFPKSKPRLIIKPCLFSFVGRDLRSAIFASSILEPVGQIKAAWWNTWH